MCRKSTPDFCALLWDVSRFSNEVEPATDEQAGASVANDLPGMLEWNPSTPGNRGHEQATYHHRVVVLINQGVDLSYRLQREYRSYVRLTEAQATLQKAHFEFVRNV